MQALPSWKAFLLLIVFIALWFGGLNHRKLFDPDEGRYAEVPREMAVTGDFVTPRLNGFKHFAKPPLQYWTTALAYKSFGVKDWTARLWPALTGALGLLLVYFTGSLLFGRAAGIAAGLVLASSLYYVFFAQVATVDMNLTLFIAAATCFIMLGLNALPGSRAERRWMLLAWAAMALAMLAKGLVGVVFPLMAVGLYTLIHRQWMLWTRLHPFTGALVFLAIAAPWFVTVSLRNPEFFHFFFVQEHFARYATTIHRRTEPFWFFLPLLLVGLLPWTWAMLESIREGWRITDKADHFHPQRFLALWGLSIIVFFSFSSAKMVAYILPAVPALGLLTGRWLSTLSEDQLRRRLVPLVIVMGVAICVAAQVTEVVKEKDIYRIFFVRYAVWLEAAGLLLLVAAAALAWRRLTPVRMIAATAAVVLVALQLSILGLEQLSPLRSGYAVAQEMKRHLRPDSEVFAVGRFDQTLPPYLGRTITLVEFAGQMAFGLQQEPYLALHSMEEFAQAWAKAPSAAALMDMSNYEQARAMAIPMRLLCSDAKRAVVRKPLPGEPAAIDAQPRNCVSSLS
ncbi:MAG TPA: phospholipid carrier-dependent glycosyltransferase [Burkholderiales bacterium]|nr:phospholipid carrier-dependent glycosyltransferase [Burkholderiales bacterium]